MRQVFALLPFALAACVAQGSDDGNRTDASSPTDDAGTDSPAAIDAPADTSTCTLGTADNCGACGKSCGTTDNKTRYDCSDATSAATCSFTCRGEFYDVDGKAENGCEAEDPIVQDSINTPLAITLPDTNDPQFQSNPLNVVGKIYGDNRQHESAPTSRPLGREDWYRVTATGTGVSNATMTACLGITNFPTDDNFEVCITDNNGTTFPASGCKTVLGGAASVCVSPTGNPDSGTFFVRVRKLAGSNTANGYALFLQH